METREDTQGERMAYQYTTTQQGYTGTYSEWLALSAGERQEYEDGAAGIPTA